jgi:hypothetical protein
LHDVLVVEGELAVMEVGARRRIAKNLSSHHQEFTSPPVADTSTSQES